MRQTPGTDRVVTDRVVTDRVVTDRASAINDKCQSSDALWTRSRTRSMISGVRSPYPSVAGCPPLWMTLIRGGDLDGRALIERKNKEDGEDWTNGDVVAHTCPGISVALWLTLTLTAAFNNELMHEFSRSKLTVHINPPTTEA